MFSLHMYIRVGQNFKTAILMGQMKANVLLSREQVEKTVSCNPFFSNWTLKICQSCNFVVFGQIVLKFGTHIIRLIWTIFWIQFGQNLHIFLIQFLHTGYPKHTDNSAHRRQLQYTYEFHAPTSFMHFRVGFGKQASPLGIVVTIL